ncbi:MAG: flagellar hook-associated protein FlgK [Pseudomonadota bacterium]
MSISAGLSNALSGLTAASRRAQVVSSNVSNAQTEGYARRELIVSARVTGGLGAGVQIDGVRRVVDEALIADRRIADADAGLSNTLSRYLDQIQNAVGLPGDPGSLDASVAGFEAALIEAAGKPDSDIRLASLLDSAQTLAQSLSDGSDKIQKTRVDADREISNEVGRLNDGLRQVADLNDLIQRARATDQDNPALEDQRQQVIDRIADIIPVRQITRDNGAVALYTTTGTLLVETEAAAFEFTATEPITADMTLASGALSGLTVDGDPVPVNAGPSSIASGSLAGLFAIRDESTVEAQARLDGLARDLVERFEDPAVDPTLMPGDAGLFTDAGGALDVLDLVGLSSRLQINDAVSPAGGGELWRLRDGINAVAPGPVGNNEQLQRLSDALNDVRAPSTALLGGASRAFAGLVSEGVAELARAAESAEQSAVFSQSRRDALKEAELDLGVDTDQEMQQLLLIEQAFAANARVIQTIDQMIQSLLEI